MDTMRKLVLKETGGYKQNSKNVGAMKRFAHKYNEETDSLDVVKPWQAAEARATTSQTALKRKAVKRARAAMKRLDRMDEAAPFCEESLLRSLHLPVPMTEEEELQEARWLWKRREVERLMALERYEDDEQPLTEDQMAELELEEEVGEFERMLDRALGLYLDW